MAPEITTEDKVKELLGKSRCSELSRKIGIVTRENKKLKSKLERALEELFTTGTKDYWERKKAFDEAMKDVKENLVGDAAAEKKESLETFSDECLAEAQREYLLRKLGNKFRFITLAKEGIVVEGSDSAKVDILSTPLDDGETRTFTKGKLEVGHITSNKGQLTVSVSGKLSDLSDEGRKALVDLLVAQSIATAGNNPKVTFKMISGTSEDALQAYDSMLKAGVKCRLEPITDPQWWTEFKQGPMGPTGHAKPGQSAKNYSDLRKEFIDMNERIRKHNENLASSQEVTLDIKKQSQQLQQ